MKAIELSGLHLGKSFRSQIYRNKNKTTKPTVGMYWESATGKQRYITLHEWKMTSLYMHVNGNILVGDHTYLRPDTELEEID